jgi:hypothetical protein
MKINTYVLNSIKKIFFFLLLITSAYLGQAQNPLIQWYEVLGQGFDDNGLGAVTDKDGNIYSLGRITNRQDVNPSPLPADTFFLGQQALEMTFVQKLDSSKNFLWAVAFAADFFSQRSKNRITLDKTGNIIITGQTNLFTSTTTVDFDPSPTATYYLPALSNIFTQSYSNGYILKLSPQGTFKWVYVPVYNFAINSSNYLYYFSVSSDDAGNIYAGGKVAGDVDFNMTDTPNDTLYTHSNSADAYIQKLDSNGNIVWVKNFPGNGNGQINALSSDAQGNCAFAGQDDNSFDINPNAGTQTITSGYYLGKLDASGNLVFGHKFSSKINTLKSNKSGAVYIVGDYNSNADMDPDIAVTTPASTIAVGGYILKLSPSGN